MCGIVGEFRYGESGAACEPGPTARAATILAHRGPDDSGIHVDGPVAFGHRRLSIVDLSPTGRQPMETDDRRFCLTYNGEFYNHAGYRARLEGKGRRFRGTSDTETLLLALAEWGPDVLEGVAGIFAFALWDRERRRLVLARDPLGVKQLYYHDDGRRIVFASEIKALFAWGDVPREVDAEAVNDYLHFHTPLFERTFFRGIRQVRSGEYLEVDRNGIRPHRYWHPEGFEPRSGEAAAQIAELQKTLEASVGEQLMSDVPVGSFFSGGIDSCAVASFALRQGRRLTCFGVHFEGEGVIDEGPYQRAAAQALGLDLQLITVDGASFPDDLLRLMYFQDEPVIGTALIPMYYVSRLAASQVKVCLGGQGADELFAGYARHALSDPWLVVKSWYRGREGAAHAGDRTGAAVGGSILKQLLDMKNIRRLAFEVPSAGSWRRRYFDHFAGVPERCWRALFDGPDFADRARARAAFGRFLDASPAGTPADRLLHWESQTYLTGLFHQDDRMSMANGLESRVPLADPRVARFAFHTPFELKLRGGTTKWILRQAVSDVIPSDVLNRRKVGFDTPAEQWVRNRHADFVRDVLLSKAARERGFWRPAGLERWLREPERPKWFDVLWKVLAIEV